MTKKVWKIIFIIYIFILIKLIVFKYPWEYLVAVTKNWEKGIILEGLSTANFTLGKSIRMYIRSKKEIYQNNGCTYGYFYLR